MRITFQNPGFRYSLDSIMLFETGEQSGWWRDPLFALYPQLDRAHADGLDIHARSAYYADVLGRVYADAEKALAEKVEKYNKHWADNEKQVTEALSDAFQMRLETLFNQITGNITLNPVCPRFLQTHTFDVFYLNSARGALGVALHEVIHFIWFHLWHEMYKDDPADYEAPHLKWILSEMAVEPIMRDERLSARNPYFARERGGCVYGYFYDMMMDGAPILDTLSDFYRSGGIRALMREGYEYCVSHEREIRSHIARAEAGTSE